MKHMLELCLISLALTTAVRPTGAAQSPEPMQKGIRVELATTRNAVPMPGADLEAALIVSVTEDGSVYLGVDRTSPAGLAEKIKSGLSGRTEKKLYLKVDARAT
jgi:biopolymer transport protein ExbD